MDSTTPKLYHKHGMDPRDFSDLYFSGKPDMVFGDDSLRFPMVNYHHQFSSGHVGGTLLIDITIASLIHHLYTASKAFKQLVLLKFNEKCIMEMNKWLHDHTGAYDWTHASAAAAELDGKRDQLQHKEMCLKASIQQILKCDFEQDNLTSPVVLPLADCVCTGLILEMISKNKEEYLTNLEKMIKLVKPGGKLIIAGLLDTTYMIVGGHRYHLLKYSESFVRDSLAKLGMAIDYFATQKRLNVSDLIDYRAVMFLVARKEG